MVNPTIIASEGGAGRYPENTAYAVRRSLAEGVDGCELDFHLTSDGHFVAHHDYRLKASITRDAAGEWLSEAGPLIRTTSLRMLRQFNFGAARPGSSVAKRYPDREQIEQESIATFADIEKAFSDLGKAESELWFEAKTDPNDLTDSTPASEYADALVKALSSSPLRTQTVLIAFDWELLNQARARLPDLKTGFLTIDFGWFGRNADGSPSMSQEKQDTWFGAWHPRDFGGSVPRAVKAAGGTYWSPYFRDIGAEDVSEAHDLGIQVSTWGADTEEEITQALATGVDSLTTGYPSRAMPLLQR